jgi:capsular polysaccharide transport system permease protein
MNLESIEREALRTAMRRVKPHSMFYRHRWLFLFVGLPTAIAALYYGFLASPVYVSQSSFVIQAPGQKATPSLSLANLVQTSGFSGGQEQTKEVLQYIRSRNALRDLQNQVNVRARYSNRGADFLSRFPLPFVDDSFENLYKYYSSMVSASFDSESDLAQVQVEAFTPEDAYQINSKLLQLSEAFVNRLNERAEGHQVAEAEERVAQAEQRVRDARLALSTYQNRQDLIDPSKQAAGVLQISDTLVAEQAALTAQLQLMERVTPRNPSIPALRNRIDAVGRQIAAQNGRAVGTPTGITSKLATYEKLTAEQEFATQALTAADAALEQARTEAQKQQFYLETVVNPNIPDNPELPHRLLRIIIIFATSICLYFIGWMIVVGILEHSPED